MAGDRIEADILAICARAMAHTTNRFVRFRKAGNLATDFELCSPAAGGSETDRGTKCKHQRVWQQAAAAVEDATARTDDVLHLRLNRPPLCPLGLVHHLDHRFAAAHRIEEVSERSDIAI
jgi:hypothetical protein